MHRPSRVGNFVIADFDKILITRSDSNFDLLDVAIPAFGCFSLNATSPTLFRGESFVFSSAPTLVTGMQTGIGIQVTGANSLKNFMYAYHASLAFENAVADDVMVELIIARLDAAPDIAALVLTTNPIHLPTKNSRLGVTNYSFAKDSLITRSEIDGGVAAVTEFDIALYWRITNLAAGSLTLKKISGRLGLYRYESDILNLDPNRQ